MSPAEIRMLLDICTIPRATFNPDKVASLLKHGLIEADLGDNTWAPTSKGNAMLGMLTATPFPEQEWVDPRTLKVIKL